MVRAISPNAAVVSGVLEARRSKRVNHFNRCFQRGIQSHAQVGKVLFGLAIHFASVTLSCCSTAATDPFANGKLVARGNEEVATWKSSPV